MNAIVLIHAHLNNLKNCHKFDSQNEYKNIVVLHSHILRFLHESFLLSLHGLGKFENNNNNDL